MSSSLKKLLIANRGKIAVSIARSAADLSVATVAIHPEDEAKSLLVGMIDEAVVLQDTGATSYLAVREATCDAIHPGYDFLRESAASDKGDVLHSLHNAATRRDMTRVLPRRDRR